jgi:hypothetical protein
MGVLVLFRRFQELVPVLCDRRCAGLVRLDHLDVPSVVRCDAVSVEEPLDVSEQEVMVGGEFRDPAVNGVEASS